MKDIFKRAILDSLPVFAGYLVLGIGYGLIMDTKGYNALWSGLMSLGIFAGAMQYVAINLLVAATPLVTVALTTLMVNARHIFYGLSMVDRYKGMGWAKPFLIFWLSDETYAIVSSKQFEDKKQARIYYFVISMSDYLYWVIGSILGGVIGSLIKFNTEGVDFALTALFVSIFTEQWISNKNHFPAVLGIAATLVCRLIFGSGSFLIPAMIIIIAVLTVYHNFDKKEETPSKEGGAS